MFDIEIVKRGTIDVVDSKLVYKVLGVKSQHIDWLRRRIENYGFEENNDYYLPLKNMKQSSGRGGHNRKDFYLTIDMAKELCMIENNDIGKKARRYFIQAEKELRKHESVRLATKQVRRSLTDAVSDSGEVERMHGHAYSTYTRLAYSLTGLSPEYKEFKKEKTTFEFRDSISSEKLERLENAESMIKSLLSLEKEYGEIKEALVPLFERKEITK